MTACKYVDEVLVYDTEADLLKILEETDWDVRILGDEYKNKEFTGRENISINAISINDLTLSQAQELRERVAYKENKKINFFFITIFTILSQSDNIMCNGP